MRKIIIVLAFITIAGFAFSQSGDNQKPPGQPASSQSAPPQGIQMQGAPGAQTTPGAQTAPGAQAPAPPAPPAPTGKRQPQAKTQEEFAAYQEVASKPDPAAMEQAANAFAQKFPDSELRSA